MSIACQKFRVRISPEVDALLFCHYINIYLYSYAGFRLTDCTGSLLDSITSEQLGVFEQDNKLSPIDTKQQLQRINGHNYVQLVSNANTKPAFFLDSRIQIFFLISFILIDGINVPKNYTFIK